MDENVGESNSDYLASNLVSIRQDLISDVVAIYENDPSVNSHHEIVRSFPGFETIMIHRFSHLTYKCGLVEYAREISELSHRRTGIDIHPGAKIKEGFSIDHGTGVVIGETVEIGSNVNLFHNVTIGALNFERNKDGTVRKKYKRHPSIGNNVTIGTGSKILGAISIGDNVKIGVNKLITRDVLDNSKII